MSLRIRTTAVRRCHTKACTFENGKMKVGAGLVATIADGADQLIFGNGLAGLDSDIRQVRKQKHKMICIVFEHNEAAECDARTIVVLIARRKDGCGGRRIDRRAIDGGDVDTVVPAADVHIRVWRAAIALSDVAVSFATPSKEAEVDSGKAAFTAPRAKIGSGQGSEGWNER